MAAAGLRPIAFAIGLLPLVWLAHKAWLGDLGINPIETVNRYLGDWALRFLLFTLAVTPLRRLTGWPGVARLRRMLGLFAFAYATLHLGSYLGLDLFFDWRAFGQDILKRRYIGFGMIAFVLLLPLALTSTNGMVRRLGGPRWRSLHSLVFPLSMFAVAHYWLMVKADIRVPLVHAVLLASLLGFRLFSLRRREANSAGGAS